MSNKGPLKSHEIGTFHEYNICIIIMLDLFWVTFHGLFPQMRPNLYETFTSDASHVLQFLKQSQNS